MIHFNNYAYSKKYREQAQAAVEAPAPVSDKSKKLSIDNKKRRRQFEERQKVHERQEQRRREDALSTRRRRQQEATNAYKAALNKELNKRSKPRSINSTPSLGASHSAATRRQLYRTPTVDEVLSNIRGHSVGGPLRTYGESTQAKVSFTSSPKENNTNTTRETCRETSRDSSRDNNREPRHKELTHKDSTATYREIREQARGDSRGDSFRDLRNDTFSSRDISRGDSRESSSNHSYQSQNEVLKREEGPAMVASAVYSKQYSEEEEPRLDDSLETGNLMELVRAQERAERESDKGGKVPSEDRRVEEDRVESDGLRASEGLRASVERVEDRISVQIDLTKFDQIDVSDCESDDTPPIDPTMYASPAPSSAPSSANSSTSTVKTSPVLLQSDQIRSRASNYFGPPSFSNGSPFRSAGTPLRVSYSAPNVGAAVANPPPEVMQKSVSSVGLCEEGCNFTIHAPDGDSHIYATNPVEAVKEAARSTAWGSNSSVTTECTETSSNKQLKSLIKRTNSGKKKQVRWDSVKALDDETMEIDQFDISSEGEAVFTRAFSHPPRSSLMFKEYYDEDNVNLQRTPTDAEINALWNKVRTTLHRNQAWDTPQHKTNLPQRMRSAPPARGRPEPPKSDALKIYSNILVEKDSRYKFNKKPTPSAHGPSTHKESPDNGHTMLSMEEQRILQSLERLDARLKDTGFDGEQKNILSYQSPVLDVGTSRTPPKSETYKRLLNRNKTNGISPKFR